MTKIEFMNQLDANLDGIASDDKKDILDDFEVHLVSRLEEQQDLFALLFLLSECT